ncbi:DUF4265 domain-containing protein [Corallincola holothuriorum]|uniref:DUF4265 domain-containing protein n=1 Tax=Corallincola holothuriorum TaxID=2282215 RepID=A0A368NLR2_9GAMM|nr:DUF4265 domain-containing protein [Corallincola holothuriorum]RCU50574.1 DUF4265 domain-containing protein [Corallincola holothuriorum]
MSNKELEKVYIDLPNHWAIGGESFWATPLGNDLYRIENVPFFAYGLNFLDVVLATSDSDELKPEIRKVVNPSGHRTYRIIFKNETEREKQVELLEALEQHEASYERADAINVAVDIKPSGDHIAVYDQLDEYEQTGFLSFETCEARIEGSFDDLPDEEENA